MPKIAVDARNGSRSVHRTPQDGAFAAGVRLMAASALFRLKLFASPTWFLSTPNRKCVPELFEHNQLRQTVPRPNSCCNPKFILQRSRTDIVRGETLTRVCCPSCLHKIRSGLATALAAQQYSASRLWLSRPRLHSQRCSMGCPQICDAIFKPSELFRGRYLERARSIPQVRKEAVVHRIDLVKAQGTVRQDYCRRDCCRSRGLYLRGILSSRR